MASVAGVAVALLAGVWPLRSGAADAAFTGFLTAFRSALVADDPAKLAALVRTPFLYEGQWLDAAGFALHAVPGLFTPEVRRCLLDVQPRIEEARYVIFCGPYGFYFGRDVQDGDYRLQEFSADGED